MKKKLVALCLTAAMAAGAFQGGTAVYAAEEYTYVYAGLSWAEYWNSEGVYLQDGAGWTDTSEELDAKKELDKGAFDAVSRATVNHGLHRGSFQCTAFIYAEDGTSYAISYWTDANTAVLTDGSTLVKNTNRDTNLTTLTHTATDGTVTEKNYSSYEVAGIKYVPVAVKTSELADFEKQYTVVENGGTLAGGYTEGNLNSYTDLTAEVTANTNGLKTAEKEADGTFTFSKRQTGTDSGLKDVDQKKVSNTTITVKEASGSYGEFLRADITTADADNATGGYGELGDNMQAVLWTYYGNDATRTNVLASYGTKFAADNWMHKAMGIQLGLTDSFRCQLPEGSDGTGYWSLTVYALGFEDTTYDIEVTSDNIVVTEDGEQTLDTTALAALVTQASALKEADYTADTWSAFATELAEAKEELAQPKSQAVLDEAATHLKAAMEGLAKKAETPEQTPSTDAAQTPSTGIVQTPPATGSTTSSIATKKVKVKKVTGKKTQATVTWAKVTGADGYQIQYAQNKKFTGAKVKNVKNVSKVVLKKLKAGKKYYIRVRAYANVNGKKVYSKYSAVKTVKTKK